MQNIPWSEYPRPLLKRDSYWNLNGSWELSAAGKTYEITVPYPPESKLSGVGCVLGVPLTYKRTFRLPQGFRKERVLLHIGAADQKADVFLNGQYAGRHVGGYEAFSLEITHLLQEENTLEILVTDDLGKKILPYGKQTEKPGGMWYTPVSGIWQTVWLESVPQTYIRSLSVTADLQSACIDTGDESLFGTVYIQTPQGNLEVPLEKGKATVTLPKPRPWCPEDPYLYTFTVIAGEDKVESYFALRKIEAKGDGIFLNGKPFFFHAVLDQGYWPDGIFTPKSPEAFEKDIRAMQDLGFNALRKHIKIEPQLFYYACDRLGMVVMQDMVNNGDYSFFRDTLLPTFGLQKRKDTRLHRDEETRTAFVAAMGSTVAALKQHPCVCYWTIFNEGWGQFCSQKMYACLKKLDSSRIIDTTSGWFRGSDSHVESLHVYFRKYRHKQAEKPTIVSEFGGYCHAVSGHVWNPKKSYGYGTFKDRQAWEDAVVSLYESQIIPHVGKGLCGAVYTQLSDVEEEINGFLTYDRAVCKATPERMRKIAEKIKSQTK